MLCYDCDHDERPAVAVCKLCGKGICRDHSVQLQRCVYEHASAGMASQLRATGRRVSMMVCTECAEAIGPSEIDERIVIRPECCPPRTNRG